MPRTNKEEPRRFTHAGSVDGMFHEEDHKGDEVAVLEAVTELTPSAPTRRQRPRIRSKSRVLLRASQAVPAT